MRNCSINSGLSSRMKVLCSFSWAKVVTMASAGSWPTTWARRDWAAALLGSRASVNFRLVSR